MATKLKSKTLFENRNTSNVFDREVIAGVLRVLNKQLKYTQIWDESSGDIEEITVPFFFDFGGGNGNSEKFIQDNYVMWTDDECTELGIKKIDGNFDFYPQGRIALKSVSIQASNITNRFVLGKYSKMVDGKVNSFVSFLYSMPLTFTFDLTVRTENMITAFKIDQAFREYFYKNKTVYINYKGIKVPVRIGFGDEFGLKSTSNYKMGDDRDQYIEQTMSLSVETYQPVFDPTNEISADTSINALGVGIKVKNVDTDNKLEIVDDLSNTTIYAGINLMLNWKSHYTDSDLQNIRVSYIDNETDETTVLDILENHEFCNITIPSELSKMLPIEVIIPNTDDCTVYKQPDFRVYPDTKTKIVTKDNIAIISKGYFITTKSYVNGLFGYEDNKGVYKEFPFKLHLKNYMIDEEDPIEFDNFVYNNKITSSNIDIIIEDVNNKDCRIEMTNITVL